MILCNICKNELKIENNKGVCPNCGKTWNLTDDNSAIKSDGIIKINNMKIKTTLKLKRKEK